MKSYIKYYLLIGGFIVVSLIAYAQDNRPTSYVGVDIGGGLSSLLFGQPFDHVNTNVRPSLGGGGLVGLHYEFEYKHFLLQTGFGVGYTINNNMFQVDDIIADVVEYPTMQYHYTFDKFAETTTYGVAYVPIMLGASFDRWYFLAGAKIGLMSFANTTRYKTDYTVWAADNDVIGPIVNIPNHGLQSYHHEGTKVKIDMNPFNTMLSAEIGVKFDKKAKIDSERKMDDAERYRELRRKKTVNELMHYRLSLFADYGLSNIHSYDTPLAVCGGQDNGELGVVNGVVNLPLHTMLEYEPYNKFPLHNLMMGIKLSIQFEFPKRVPKKGAMALPYLYVYVQDDVTAKPIPDAHVQIKQAENTKLIYDKNTDAEFGRVGKACKPNKYCIYVSHQDYCDIDSIHYEHKDDYDTLHVALYPKKQMCWFVENAMTNEQMAAQVKIVSSDGKEEHELTTDSTCHVCAMLDNRQSYVMTASAEGFEVYNKILSIDNANEQIQLTPLIKRTFVIPKMYFVNAKTTLLTSSQKALDVLYEMLSENPDLCIRIIGHTDNVGSDEKNKVLSQGRANSVRKEMVRRGIKAERMLTEGKGESEPIVPNTSESNRQKNRRVEIEIVSGGDNINIEHLVQ